MMFQMMAVQASLVLEWQAAAKTLGGCVEVYMLERGGLSSHLFEMQMFRERGLEKEALLYHLTGPQVILQQMSLSEQEGLSYRPTATQGILVAAWMLEREDDP